jgi:DNA invertase Pin-like site-specific DNA recombinase
VYGYLRVSSGKQDTAKNRAAVAEFAERHGFGKVRFIEETASGKLPWKRRKLGQLVEGLKAGDRLVCPELSRLGRSVVQVLEVLNLLGEKGVEVWSVKEASLLNGSGITALVSRTILSLLAEIERTLIVERTREGLAAAKAKGTRLGRPAGRGKSKLDKHRAEIVQAHFQNGERVASLARRFQCSQCCVKTWLRHEARDATITRIRREP